MSEARRLKIPHEGYEWIVELWERKTVVEATHPSIKDKAFEHTFQHKGEWRVVVPERDYVVAILNECIKMMKERRRA